MNIKKILNILVFILLSAVGVYAQANDVPKTMKPFAENELSNIGRNRVIVNAVIAQNLKNRSLDQIKTIDSQWQNSSGVTRYMLDLMSNDCALELYNVQQKYPFIVESFVMDNKGANVGQTGKTSDYWQGDEAKFTGSFVGGKGAIHTGNVEYDDSIDEIIVQISVPVVSGNAAVGAITFGISLDRWERK